MYNLIISIIATTLIGILFYSSLKYSEVAFGSEPISIRDLIRELFSAFFKSSDKKNKIYNRTNRKTA